MFGCTFRCGSPTSGQTLTMIPNSRANLGARIAKSAVCLVSPERNEMQRISANGESLCTGVYESGQASKEKRKRPLEHVHSINDGMGLLINGSSPFAPLIQQANALFFVSAEDLASQGCGVVLIRTEQHSWNPSDGCWARHDRDTAAAVTPEHLLQVNVSLQLLSNRARTHTTLHQYNNGLMQLLCDVISTMVRFTSNVRYVLH